MSNKDITIDDFTYSLQNENGELSDAEKEMLMNMAQIMKSKLEERKMSNPTKNPEKV